MGKPAVIRVLDALLAAHRKELKAVERGKEVEDKVVLSYKPAGAATQTVETLQSLQEVASALRAGSDAAALPRAIQFCVANAGLVRHLALPFFGNMSCERGSHAPRATPHPSPQHSRPPLPPPAAVHPPPSPSIQTRASTRSFPGCRTRASTRSCSCL